MTAPAPDPGIYEQFIGSVQNVVGRAVRNGQVAPQDRDDAEQFLHLAGLQLVANFDPARGIPLTAWVHSHLRKRLVDFTREQARRSREESTGDEHHEEHARVDDDPLRLILRREERDRIRRLVDRLPAAERDLIRARYGIGRREHRESDLVAAGLGTRDAIASRHQRALRRLGSMSDVA